MKALCSWIESRTGLCGWLAACGAARVPGRVCLCRSLPFVLGFAFVFQAITGIFLLMRYCPSAASAWESVYWLQYEVQGGWLLRAVHHYCGQAVLVLVGVQFVVMILRGAYRAPREFVFWCVLLLGIVTLGLLLTGDLLAWDENSRSATLTRVNFLQSLPEVGGALFKLAAAGPEFGSLTLSQFTTLHALLLPAAFLVLLVLRWWFARRATTVEAAEAPAGSPYWPRQVAANLVGCLVFLTVVFALALAHGTTGDGRGVALGSPANPAEFYEAARPEWAFMGLYGMSEFKVFGGGGTVVHIFIAPSIMLCLFLLMPFTGRFKIGHVLNIVLVVVLLVGDVYLSYKIYARDDSDPLHQAAIRQSQLAAARIPVLIRHHGGIPPEGPLALLRNDPKTQGPALFKRHCATCHDWVGGAADDIKAEESSAPNLFAFGSREKIAGLLDPKQIAGDEYFGNTAFKRGKMVDFVREMFSDMEPEDLEDRNLLVMALSAEAKLPAQKVIDQKDAEQIAEGRELIVDYCTDCHQFGKSGRLGTAPELTGYASREWTVGIIANPADPRFYGKNNDRMQAYAESDDETKNLMTNREIEVLTDWLRGDWYEPEGSGQ